MILGSTWGMDWKVKQSMRLLPTSKRWIQGAQGEAKCAHSCFSYEQYSHFSDNHALQALPKITK